MKRIIPALILAVAAFSAHADPALEARVAELEKELTELKASLVPIIEKEQAAQNIAKQRNDARIRMRKDVEVYSREELDSLEKIYQSANRQLSAPESKAHLKQVIAEYGKANRAGCAMLYLGQVSKSEEREKYLKNAIIDYSDCYYGDGVQVGAYARYYLAYYYKETGQADKAAELFEEIKNLYPNAIDHKGRLLADLIKSK